MNTIEKTYKKGGKVLMNTEQRGKGFTIIEVVLVLAIAGLIFLMVFVALPALQRNQRDTQRKNDLSRAQVALTNYTTNNKGSLPADWDAFASNYLTVGGDTFVDPSSGLSYSFSIKADGGIEAFSTEAPKISVTVGSVCNGDTLTDKQGGRKVALRMKLEGGGIACVNN